MSAPSDEDREVREAILCVWRCFGDGRDDDEVAFAMDFFSDHDDHDNEEGGGHGGGGGEKVNVFSCNG